MQVMPPPLLTQFSNQSVLEITVGYIGDVVKKNEIDHPACQRVTPISIENDHFLKLILREQTPLLTCFGTETRQQWLLPRRINLRKAVFSIDVGVKLEQSAST